MKPSERIQEIISKIPDALDHTNPGPTIFAIIEYLDEEYERKNSYNRGEHIASKKGEIGCGKVMWKSFNS